jgi:PIN domain nuclease of toxin-antitoxin system
VIALDASALLAFLFREAGHDAVARHIDRCCLSTVNLAEVLGRFARDGHDPNDVLARLAATSIEIVPFGPRDAAAAAALVPATRPLGLSLGDRACLALAAVRDIPALTADRIWADLDVAVTIEIAR